MPIAFTLLDVSSGDSPQVRLARQELEAWLAPDGCAPDCRATHLLEILGCDCPQWSLSLDEPFAVGKTGSRNGLE